MADAQTKVAEKSVPWWLVLLQGIATLIIGIFLVTSPNATTAVLVRFLGFYWFFMGIFSIVEIFLGDKETHWAILLLKGVLGIIAGLIVLDHPLLSPIFVTSVVIVILGIEGVIYGILGLVGAFQGGGWGVGILAVLSILFGILLLANVWIAAFALPVALGVLAIIGGLATIIFSFTMDKGE